MNKDAINICVQIFLKTALLGYNLYTIKFTHLLYNSVFFCFFCFFFFSKFMELCNHCHSQFRLFPSLLRDPCAHLHCDPVPASSPRQLQIWFQNQIFTFVLLKNPFGYSGTFAFPYKFGGWLFSFHKKKKSGGIFIGILLNLYIESVDHFVLFCF